MKKILFYLPILLAFGCNEDANIETVEKELVTTITINEHNITGPANSIPSQPSTIDKSLFEVEIPFSLPEGELSSSLFKKITVNSIQYDVEKYECGAPELHGSFHYDVEPATFVVTSFKEDSNNLGAYYKSKFHDQIGNKLSGDFLKTNGTTILLRGTIDNSYVPFEVRLTFRLNATIERLK